MKVCGRSCHRSQIVECCRARRQPPYAAMQGRPGLGHSEVSANSAPRPSCATWGTQFGRAAIPVGVRPLFSLGQHGNNTQDVADIPASWSHIPQVLVTFRRIASNG